MWEVTCWLLWSFSFLTHELKRSIFNPKRVSLDWCWVWLDCIWISSIHASFISLSQEFGLIIFELIKSWLSLGLVYPQWSVAWIGGLLKFEFIKLIGSIVLLDFPYQIIWVSCLVGLYYNCLLSEFVTWNTISFIWIFTSSCGSIILILGS